MDTLYIVEDDDIDRMSYQRSAQSALLSFDLVFFKTGIELMDHVHNAASDDKGPVAIVLDFNLPGMSGLDCIKALKENIGTRHWPIWVVSTSAAPQDIAEVYRYGATGFISKYDTGNNFELVFSLLEQYAALVTLPQATDMGH